MSARTPTRPRPAALQDPDDAGLRDRLVDLETELPQPVGDQLPGAGLAVAELGMAVEVAPRLHQPRRQRLDRGADLRRRSRGGDGGQHDACEHESPLRFRMKAGV